MVQGKRREGLSSDLPAKAFLSSSSPSHCFIINSSICLSTLLPSYQQCSFLHIAVPNPDTTRHELCSRLHACNSTPACPGSEQPPPSQSCSGSHLSSSCPSTQLLYFCPSRTGLAQLSCRACCLQCSGIRAALSVRTSTRAVP